MGSYPEALMTDAAALELARQWAAHPEAVGGIGTSWVEVHEQKVEAICGQLALLGQHGLYLRDRRVARIVEVPLGVPYYEAFLDPDSSKWQADNDKIFEVYRHRRGVKARLHVGRFVNYLTKFGQGNEE